jgi:glycosyltransferase involved in cell wall biosynthesis
VRVLFLAHSFPRHTADVAGSFLLRLAVALRDRGVEVRVLAPDAEGLAAQEVLDGVTVRRFRYAPRGWQTLAYTGAMADEARRSARGAAAMLGLVGAGARATRREALEWRADVVHAHWWFPGGLSAALPSARGGRPLVLTLHGSDVRLAAGVAPARALFARVAARAGAVTAVSRWLCERASGMAPGLRCEVAPMPVAAEHFAPPAPGRAREGVLFVGRLTAQKGVDRLLQAAARQLPGVALTIVGDGPEEGALRSLATSLGVADRVRWLGARPQDELGALYGASRVLAVPSREEGLGLVAVEAQLCGTPVVAFASGGLSDVVHDAADGLLVPEGDEVAFGAALSRLVHDDDLASRLGAGARAGALASFSPAAVAARYAAVYERVRRQGAGARSA